MKYLILISISILVFTSCEKEISIDQKEFSPKIVLNSIINSENDTIIVELSESRDMLYDKFDFPPIKDATIKLYDNNIFAGTLTELFDGYYILPYSVIPNHTYRLEVSNTNLDNVTASTTVPTPAVINDFTVTLNSNLKANINVVFQDPAGESNFYGIEISRLDSTLDTTGYYGGYSISDYACSNSTAIEYPAANGIDGANCTNLFLFSDKLFAGSTFTFNCYNENTFWNTPPEELGLFTKIWVNLKTINEDYYQYQLSTNLALENYGNPFAEPVRIYSNVEGGFGIFGSYSIYKDSISF